MDYCIYRITAEGARSYLTTVTGRDALLAWHKERYPQVVNPMALNQFADELDAEVLSKFYVDFDDGFPFAHNSQARYVVAGLKHYEVICRPVTQILYMRLVDDLPYIPEQVALTNFMLAQAKRGNRKS